MADSTRYAVNAPQVIGEVIDDEAVIVNLDSGAYYNLVGLGGRIWQWLVAGSSVAEINAVLQSQYPNESALSDDMLLQFLADLQAEGLISVSADDAAVMLPDTSDLPPFETPSLRKFTDLENMLLLDPIHDVDDAGWPHPASEEE